MQKMLQEGGEEQVRRDQLLTIVCLLYTVYKTHTQANTVCGCRRANGGACMKLCGTFCPARWTWQRPKC
jgi:hypothetical protein